MSTADAYLRPAAGRSNLSVHTHAQVTRVLIEDRRAVGVEVLQHGQVRRLAARAEVILCGGAVNTPQLLMLSGIGDGKQLAALGLDVVVDAPQVGQQLRDHLVAMLVVDTRRGTLYTATGLGPRLDYLLRRRGMLTSNAAEAYGFVRSGPDVDLPDVEVLFTPVASVDEGLTDIPGHGLTLGAILLQPASAGTITLASPDPLDKPLIDPRYLSDEAGRDRAVMLRGLAVCERLLRSPSLARLVGGRFLSPWGSEVLPEEARDREALTWSAQTLYHPTSTVRMGSDPATPVDPELRVRGVSGLRVADASVMPEIIRGHTNAPSIVIGERAADLVLAAFLDGRTRGPVTLG